MDRTRWVLSLAFVVGSLSSCGDQTPPQDAGQKVPAPASRGAAAPQDWKAEARANLKKSIEWLRSQQAGDGRWKPFDKMPKADVATSSLVLLALTEAPKDLRGDDPSYITKGLDWLASNQKDDGGIHDGNVATYATAISMLALKASGDPKYEPVLKKGLEYLRVIQSDESEKLTSGDRFYGGWGFEGERPDLSITQFALEAARAAGAPPDDPMFKKAMVFLNRAQNHSETNDLKDPGLKSGNDGGAYYGPHLEPDEAKAGLIELPDGSKIRRSYGSMSYSLLKSLIFCNLDRRDSRVRALLDWMNKNYRVDVNPGMEGGAEANAGMRGVFYYYMAMARSLPVAGDAVPVDADNKARPWRRDLATQLARMQRPDGSYANVAPAFYEHSPTISTAYAVIALGACVR